MTSHIALLRAVNVGGTGKLPMADLRRLAMELGFERPRTSIASGNLVFDSPLGGDAARARLEGGLRALMGRSVGVVLTARTELQALLAANPFPDAAPNRVLVTLLNGALPDDWPAGVRHQQGEQIVAVARALFVHYGAGMAQSRLRIAAAEAGTARNLNTLRALVERANDSTA
jgi:uncharacterized protein (DUF1697 family)